MIDDGAFTPAASRVHFAALRPPLTLPSMVDVTPQKPEESPSPDVSKTVNGSVHSFWRLFHEAHPRTAKAGTSSMIDGGAFTSAASKVHFAGLRPPLTLPFMVDVTPQKPEESPSPDVSKNRKRVSA